jgi:hypothetical protein
VEPFRSRIHSKDGIAIRDQIAMWAKTLPYEIVDWPELPPEIQDRDADVWEPLIIIADAVGGTWPEKARLAAKALVTADRDAEPSLGMRLLADLRTVFGGAKDMTTKAILIALIGLEESPWGDIRGKPLDERGLAKRLRAYGIRSKGVGDEIPSPVTRQVPLSPLSPLIVRKIKGMVRAAGRSERIRERMNRSERIAERIAERIRERSERMSERMTLLKTPMISTSRAEERIERTYPLTGATSAITASDPVPIPTNCSRCMVVNGRSCSTGAA